MNTMKNVPSSSIKLQDCMIVTAKMYKLENPEDITTKNINYQIET